MKARITFVLVAWLAAFLIVMLLFLLLGGWLATLPLVARAALISGVLVIAMTQLVIPQITRRLGRRPEV